MIEKNNQRIFGLRNKRKIEYTTYLRNIIIHGINNIFMEPVNLVSATHCNEGSDLYYWESIDAIIPKGFDICNVKITFK